MPSLNTTLRLMNVGVSSMTSEPDIGATKSSGLRHLSCITSHTWARERVGLPAEGLMGRVWDWVRVTIVASLERSLLGRCVSVLLVGACRARMCGIGGGGRGSQRMVSFVFIRSFEAFGRARCCIALRSYASSNTILVQLPSRLWHQLIDAQDMIRKRVLSMKAHVDRSALRGLRKPNCCCCFDSGEMVVRMRYGA